jgi:ribonucleoside-diphosphate reductase alpha chain
MNAGRELGQLSACFVLPVEDSIEEIYDTLKNQALIHKSGGGTGFGFSRLRPKNDLVKSTMGVSSGPVSFMQVFDSSTEHIKQGGTRRGANMGILRVDHPDIEEFIAAKHEGEAVNNFNISVAITNEFMEAVEEGSEFALRNPRDGEVHSKLDARELFGKIVEGAWRNGEPGVVFIDRINNDNPTPQFPIESTNPCSEAHLPPYDSCNLGSINLERFVIEREVSENGSGRKTCVDWETLADTVRTAVRFLDNVVEANAYPLEEIARMSRGNRRIGLGVMGFADALIKLGVPYDSEKGLALAESFSEWIDRHAWEASRELAEERGVFDNYEGSAHEARGDRVRNATVTTIAPTGTISMIAGCSGGIEPLFAVAFMRRQADMEMADVNPEFVRQLKERGIYSEELIEKVAHHGGVQKIEELPEDLKEVWRTSSDIRPEEHVRMQAAFQKHTSMGISKTINLPNEAKPLDIAEAYWQAYELGCKGLAVYRDGSRDAQVLSTGSTGSTASTDSVTEAGAAEEPAAGGSVPLAEARNGRPRTLMGVTKKLQTGHGPLYVMMNDDEFGPRECFVVIGKPGGTAAAFSDALGRMISLAMTRGATPGEVHHQLRGIQDGHPAGVGPNAILSVPDGVAKALSETYLEVEEAGDYGPGFDTSNGTSDEARELPVVGACPDCGSELAREEGCVVCRASGCGFSRCS